MTIFELDYSKFERNQQINQLSTTFNFTVEGVFEILDTEDLDMPSAHSIIDPISKKNYDNAFHQQNGSNHLQHVHKTTGKQYQSRSFQKPRSFSISHLKEKCFGCGLNNKETGELFIQHDVKLETRPLRGHFLSIKRQQEKRSFRTTTNMDQYPKTSTRILIHQYKVPPKLQLIVIDIK